MLRDDFRNVTYLVLTSRCGKSPVVVGGQLQNSQVWLGIVSQILVDNITFKCSKS
jgi:hypothetical protein